jgi:glycosyltransferase involved in cell wall biosynthesis
MRLKSADIFLDYKNFFWADYVKNIHAKKIVVFHGSFVLFQKWECIKKLPKYDKVICLTDNFKNDFINNYPEYKDKIEHIYNPLNVNEILLKAKKDALVSNKKYFIAVQRLDNRDKDVVTIIRAFDIFCKNHSEVYLYIVGNGPDKEALQTIAKNNPNISFIGQVNNPYSLIKNAQALILSSIKDFGEGLPTVLLEAHVLGTLAISSDVPSGPREVLMNGEAGILFEPHNEKELADIMSNVIKNSIAKNDLINCATENLNRFDSSVVCEKFLSIIQKN